MVCSKMSAQQNVDASVFVCVFTPCLERLVVVSPSLVHWGAAICSSSGNKGRLAPCPIHDLTQFSQPPQPRSHRQFTLLTRGGRSHSIQAELCSCQVSSLSDVFIQHVMRLGYESLVVQVRIFHIICHRF